MTDENAANEAAKATEENEKQNLFNEKVKAFKEDMNALAEEHGVGIIAGSYFYKEGAVGVDSFGTLTQIEQLGLSTAIKQRFAI